MSNEEEQQHVWYVGRHKVGKGDGVDPHMIESVRSVTDEEVKRIDSALGFLNELTENAPFRCLRDKYYEFNEYVAALVEHNRSGKTDAAALKVVPTKLDDLLSALKAFEDRTRHNLSRRYGKHSPKIELFDASLSFEYDNVFAYRFCYKLRNYSQHVGSPISDMQLTAGLENGKVVSSCKLIMDSNDLLVKYGEWGKDVKADLKRINGKFLLEPVLAALMESCLRVYYKLLVSQENDIREAVDTVKSFVGELGEGWRPILIRVKKDVKGPSDLKNIQVRNVKAGLIDLLDSLLQQAQGVVGSKL